MAGTEKIVNFPGFSGAGGMQALPARRIFVGDAADPELANLQACGTEALRIIPFAALTPALLRALRPPMIIARALDGAHDCYDLANLVHEAGIRTSLCLLPDGLADPGLVRRELAAAFPEQEIQFCRLSGACQIARNSSR